MEVPGHLSNGVVVLEGEHSLQDGARVVVSCTQQAQGAIAIPSDLPLEQVLQVTRDVFASDVQVASMVDPEFPANRYLRLTVEAAGDNAAILHQEAEWARRVTQIRPVWDGFKLRVKRKK